MNVKPSQRHEWRKLAPYLWVLALAYPLMLVVAIIGERNNGRDDTLRSLLAVTGFVSGVLRLIPNGIWIALAVYVFFRSALYVIGTVVESAVERAVTRRFKDFERDIGRFFFEDVKIDLATGRIVADDNFNLLAKVEARARRERGLEESYEEAD